MTLLELSEQYEFSSQLLRQRIAVLRKMAQEATDEEARRRLQRRVHDLQPLLSQCRQIRDLTAHYYERSFHRHENYTL